MKITVFGGAREIGGNQILVEGRETKILLDFGRNFTRESNYFEAPYLSPRRGEQLHQLGILPPIEGIYPWDDREPCVSGILISHAHLDHMDYVRYVRKDIPIFVGEGTWKIISAREVTSLPPSDYRLAEFRNELSDEPRECVYSCRSFSIQCFRTGRELSVGEFRIRPVHVDHSIPAAYGFVIDGPDGRIAYTGDIRFHGSKPNFSEDFLRAAENPDVLITEGTNVTEFKPSSEEEVGRKLDQIFRKVKSGLLAASFSAVDTDRMKTIYAAAVKNGRKLVISMRQAFLIEMLSGEIKKGLLDFPFLLGNENVLIYMREKKTDRKWESKIERKYGAVDASWVSEHQDEVVLSATYYDMLEMLSIRPKPGSVFIYSESEPWDEEGEIEFEKLENWLEELGMPLFHVHASGHASPFELREVVERLGPKKVVVVHSERPELFKRFVGDGRLVCPQHGVPIEI